MHGILFSIKQGRNFDICYNIGGDLKDIMLIKISQSPRDKYCMHSLT